MAASKSQGSYLAVFWAAVTALCAGIAYVAEGFGIAVLIIGLAGVAFSLVGFLKIKALEGKTAEPAGSPALKMMGIMVALGGWFVTIAGLHLTTSVGGRLIFALAGIAISLVGVLGVLPVAFGKSVAGKAESPAFISAKATLEQSR